MAADEPKISPEVSAALVTRLVRDSADDIISWCRREMLARPELLSVVIQLRVAESEEWLREAISLFQMCMTSAWPAMEWHDEVGGINFAAGLTIADANKVLGILRDGFLRLVWRGLEQGTLGPKDLPGATAAVLRAFDRALSAQASAYVRESQRHLAEINKQLALRQEVIDRDIALATMVQRQFIPTNFLSTNFRAEVRYMPTTGVGGDHAGIFPVGPDKLYVTICDVTGHGVASALVAEIVSSHLRPMLGPLVDSTFQYSVDPVSIIRELNRLFYEDFQPLGILLSFFVALIDARKETLTYSGAGHPPPILQCCAAHNFMELRSQNIILGAAQDCVVGEGQETCAIHRGDRIIFYTDGIIEAHDDRGNMLGRDGLRAIIGKHYDTTQTELADEILAAARSMSSQDEPDDMSLILVDILKEQEEASPSWDV